MPIVAALPLIAGGIVAGGSIFAGLKGAKAATQAAEIQAQSARNALDFQKEQFDYQKGQNDKLQANFRPFIDAGAGATGQLTRLNNGDFSQFFQSPDYKFAFDQGMRGVTAYENSKGLGLSGGALKDVTQFASGLATQNYGNYYSRLMSLAQLGSGAAAGAGGVGSSFANSLTNASNGIGNTIQGIGQAQASGVVGSANAWNGAIGNGVNNSLLAAALFNRGSTSSYNTGGGGDYGAGSFDPFSGRFGRI